MAAEVGEDHELVKVFRAKGSQATKEPIHAILVEYRDGLRILGAMARMFRDVRPLPFFSGCALLFALVGLALGAEVVAEFVATGLVPRLPSAVLATGLMLLASLSLACGIILESVARGRREAKRLAYLAAGAARR